jgi:photosystem II stability/assembly factor-like uncharacterized protein
MKSILLIIMVFLFTTNAISQHWMSEIHNKNEVVGFATLNEAFESWSDGRDLSKMKGWRSFKRWSWFVEQRMYGNETTPNPMIHYNELQKFIQNSHTKGNSKGTWISLSPSSLPPSPDPMSIHGMGRINCIAFHPTDTFTYYVGASQGGVWKTTDGGSSWIPLTDHLPVMAVSDIAINPHNPDVIYLSTGDINYVGYNSIALGRATQFGMGLLKSTDGGITWDTTGLTYIPSQGQITLLRRVFINPSDTSQVVAAGVNGVFFSNDGGQTFAQTQSGVFIDFEQNPLKPQTLYVMGLFYPSIANSGARMYRSYDFGQNWDELTTSIPISGSVLRTEIAIAPSDTNYLYALSCGYSGGFHSFHRSVDAGQTWARVASRQAVDKAPNMLGWADGDYFGFALPGVAKDTTGQGTYDLTLIVHPNNKDIVYSGGVNFWGTVNGGLGGDSSTWNVASMWLGYFGESVHADQHSMGYHPLTGELFISGDGGLYKTDSLKIGDLDQVLPCINLTTFEIIPGCYELPTDWTFLSHGVHNTEFYRLGLSRADKDMIAGGTQDNGTYLFKDGAWMNTYGGDGMEVMLHHTNRNIIYATNYNGMLSKSIDGGLTYTSGLETPITNTGETGDWVTPYVMDPWNPEILYTGFRNIWKSENGGTTWTKISNWGTQFNIRALAVAPSNPNYIYASRAGAIFRTKNGGTDWQSISSGLPLTQALITYIAVSFHDPAVAWVSLSGFQDGIKVFKTTDAGASWVNISHNLPNVPVNCIAHQAGQNTQGDTLNGIYVGTDIGVFYTNDSLLQTTQQWIMYNNGLPSVIVSELEIQYEAQKIVAATYGRGIWESALYEETNIEGLGIDNQHTYQPVFQIYPNPASRQLFFNVSKTIPGDITASILNMQGKLILQKSFDCQEKFQGSIDINELPVGSYILKVKNGNTIFSSVFVVV